MRKQSHYSGYNAFITLIKLLIYLPYDAMPLYKQCRALHFKITMTETSWMDERKLKLNDDTDLVAEVSRELV